MTKNAVSADSASPKISYACDEVPKGMIPLKTLLLPLETMLRKYGRLGRGGLEPLWLIAIKRAGLGESKVHFFNDDAISGAGASTALQGAFTRMFIETQCFKNATGTPCTREDILVTNPPSPTGGGECIVQPYIREGVTIDEKLLEKYLERNVGKAAAKAVIL